MKFRFLVSVGMIVGIMCLAVPVSAQQVPYTCESGTTFENAIEFSIDLRPAAYTVTVLGIDGFNPQVAVVTENGDELACEDDSPAAAAYSLNLPTTGEVAASASNAQATINVNGQGFTEVSIIVGSVDGEGGSFVVLFDTLRATSDDFQGDPFIFPVTDVLTSADTPLTIYMIALSESLDPLIQVATGSYKPILFEGQPLACDDAGTLACYDKGASFAEETTINTKTTIAPNYLDAALTLSADIIEQVQTARGNLVVLMSSFNQQTQGEYMVVLHVTIGT